MLKIGDFSKLTHVSIRMLRHGAGGRCPQAQSGRIERLDRHHPDLADTDAVGKARRRLTRLAEAAVDALQR